MQWAEQGLSWDPLGRPGPNLPRCIRRTNDQTEWLWSLLLFPQGKASACSHLARPEGPGSKKYGLVALCPLIR